MSEIARDQIWYASTVPDMPCPKCGYPLWGDNWWDGWKNEMFVDVQCSDCGTSWEAEIQYPEPEVVGMYNRSNVTSSSTHSSPDCEEDIG